MQSIHFERSSFYDTYNTIMYEAIEMILISRCHVATIEIFIFYLLWSHALILCFVFLQVVKLLDIVKPSEGKEQFEDLCDIIPFYLNAYPSDIWCSS